ncbi:unnamed protein product [Ixodes pacificus]
MGDRSVFIRTKPTRKSSSLRLPASSELGLNTNTAAVPFPTCSIPDPSQQSKFGFLAHVGSTRTTSASGKFTRQAAKPRSLTSFKVTYWGSSPLSGTLHNSEVMTPLYPVVSTVTIRYHTPKKILKE